jgi:hypothetical protein
VTPAIPLETGLVFRPGNEQDRPVGRSCLRDFVRLTVLGIFYGAMTLLRRACRKWL